MKSWKPIAKHGDPAEEIQERLVQQAGDAMKVLRRELVKVGTPDAVIAVVLAKAWKAYMDNIDEQVPQMLMDLATTTGNASPLH